MAEQTEGGEAVELGLQQEENEDTVLSMVDVLKESEELEEEATAVLGDSDDKCCTYPLGYRGRQALYACATCTAATEQSAGICLACSYECHEGHQLYELYTKRNVRCDCGNSLFGSMKCKLIQNKDATNPDNKYNQNFRGVYCICSRPYPDPEDKIGDEMIQCVVCEDWFHSRHLGGVSVPDSNDYQEMVCTRCMQGSCDFLWNYNISSKEVKLELGDSSIDVDIEQVSTSAAGPGSGQEEQTAISETSDTKPADPQPASLHESPPCIAQPGGVTTPCATGAVAPTKTTPMPEHADPAFETVHRHREAAASMALSQGSEAGVSSSSSGSLPSTLHQDGRPRGDEQAATGGCKLKELKSREIEKKEHATFWPSGWRSKLCTCKECKILYESRKVSFLMEESDTVLAYEIRGKLKHAGSSQYQMGMEALTTLNRVQQVEVLHEYNDLKTSLRDYLQSFVNQGKVVKRQDIDEFFTDMQSRKKQRVGVGNPQYFCR